MTLSGDVAGATGEVLMPAPPHGLAIAGKRIAQPAATAGREGPVARPFLDCSVQERGYHVAHAG